MSSPLEPPGGRLFARGNVWDGTSPIDATQQPFALFLVQLLIILLLARALGLGFQFIKQPRVIAEVVSGILLGPSALGRIPGFTTTIFPPQSLPSLRTFAGLGLCFYLFLVGLELNPAVLRKNARRALGTSIAGMIVPFALGAAVSWALYRQYMDVPGAQNVPSFGSFLLFLGVAMAITAFPVLARILAERKLFPTKVGVAVISAAAVDDATAWCLLALTVAIAQASNLLYALYTFLCTVGWTLLLVLGLKPLLLMAVRWAETKGPGSAVNEALVFAIFALVIFSSFMTEMIGVHAIFGAFIMGLATPHESGFALRLTAKIEDFVVLIFLPVYFALSGIRTNIGLLNSALAWAYVVLVIAVACAGKIFGCLFAARLSGLTWRESWAVGILMNTKGLVELIVLNVGLSAGVINETIFAIMVIMALVTTFMTAPIIMAIYPTKYYTYADGVDLHALGLHAPEDSSSASRTQDAAPSLELRQQFKGLEPVDAVSIPGAVFSTNQSILLCLTDERTLPGLMLLTASLARGSGSTVHALRLSQLSDRISSVSVAVNFADSDNAIASDGVLAVFGGFASLLGIPIEASFGFVDGAYGPEITGKAMQKNVGLVVLSLDHSTSVGSVADASSEFRRNKTISDEVFEALRFACPGLVSLDRGYGSIALGGQGTAATVKRSDINAQSGQLTLRRTIALVFAGGLDDREAASVAARLASDRDSALLILRVRKTEAKAGADDEASISLLVAQRGATVEDFSNVAALVPKIESLTRRDVVILGRNARYGGAQPGASSSGKRLPFLRHRTGSDAGVPPGTSEWLLDQWGDELIGHGLGPGQLMVVQGKHPQQ
ncbi:Sodium/hydrogen exchanger family-domain-containing protein [Hyaloraphidium curvatum]|nr:Sodium/hydrogen exchanger family-domain-containing protein [Hyaloraphidium curvatum]